MYRMRKSARRSLGEDGDTPCSLLMLMWMWISSHVETDSPTYSWMNSKFFIVQVDTSNLPAVSFTMYDDTTSAPASSTRKRSR